MASDGEDINITPAESLASATDTEDEELDPPHGNSDFESDDEILEVEEARSPPAPTAPEDCPWLP